MVCHGRRVVSTRQRFKMLRFTVMQPTLCLSNVKGVAIPTASFVHNLRHKGTAESVLIGEKVLNSTSVSENNFKTKTTIEPVDT